MTRISPNSRFLLSLLSSLAAGVAVWWICLRHQTGFPLLLGSLILPAIGGVIVWICMKRANRAQTELVPEHFQSALDSLHQGVVVIDYSGQIAFANQFFLEMAETPRDELLQLKVRELNWSWRDSEKSDEAAPDRPWLEIVKEGRSRCGSIPQLGSGVSRTYVMNAVPLQVETHRARGALVSFEDVTQLHKKQSELASLLNTVRKSAQQIRRQNSELEQMALRDPLTGCFHRRSGVEMLERQLQDALRHESDLACLILDIDHFRTINDQQGHLLADRILREVGNTLLDAVEMNGFVCRFGGEEFLLVLPQTSLPEACQFAERVRQDIARLRVEDLSLTASLGVSAIGPETSSVQTLLMQADASLNRAKQLGRNRVVQFEELHDENSDDASLPARLEESTTIPFPAVTALISALAYRDLATASHSRRVANLCVAMGQRVMSMSSCYVMEMAALLHDIGKIGVPDAILLKPTPLSEDEWEVMHAHERMGIEIVRSAFGSSDLTAILEAGSCHYSESLQQDESLPLGARILAVADAYDSMTTEQVFRAALSPAEAIAELRRCAGSQFDPEIVSQFVEILFLQQRDFTPTHEVAVEAALVFGRELERLALAVDHQDLETLKLLAGHLCQTATKNGAIEISAKAMELEQMAISGSDLLGVFRCAGDLLSHCRATQAIYVKAIHGQLRDGVSSEIAEPTIIQIA